MIRFLQYLFLVLGSVLIFTYCNQPPPTAPQSLIPNEDLINARHTNSDSLNLSQSSSFYEKQIALGIANRVLLGKNEYSSADLLYRFSVYVPDTTLTYIKNGQAAITKAWITMKPSYSLGDTTKPFGFTAYQIRSDWGLLEFNRDSLNALQYDQTNVLLNTPQPGVTTKDSIIAELNPDVVKEWVTYDSTVAGSKKNYGLIFKPTAATGRYLGFKASTSDSAKKISQLHVIIHNANWATDDSIQVIPWMDSHIMEKSALPVSNDRIYLEGSYAIRGFLFFDLSTIPSNIIINKAVLTLNYDANSSTNGSVASDTLLVNVLADSTLKTFNSDSTKSSILYRSGSAFSGDITWMVQKWIKHDSSYPNEGMTFYLYNENASAARQVFYGSRYADKALRPKLDLYFTSKN